MPRRCLVRPSGDRVVSAAQFVLVVQDVALGDDVLGPLHIDRELVAKRCEPRLAALNFRTVLSEEAPKVELALT